MDLIKQVQASYHLPLLELQSRLLIIEAHFVKVAVTLSSAIFQ